MDHEPKTFENHTALKRRTDFSPSVGDDVYGEIANW